MMIKLIVNADDFGFSAGVNYGIIHSHLNGIVNSTTVMMNMPGTEHALALAQQHPCLRIGLHLVLTCGKPLLSGMRSLTDENGVFKSQSSLQDVSLDELEQEWSEQINRFLHSVSFG